MLLGTQNQAFMPDNLVEKFKCVKDMGFDAFEIDGSYILNDIDGVKKAIRETGLKVSSVCGGYRGWIGDFIEERRLNSIKDISRILERLPELGATGIVVPAAWGMFTYRLPPHVSPRSKEGDRAAILDSLSKLDSVAGENGVYLYLEPLNRYQDHMLNTASDAVSIIDEGKFKNVKMTFDFYHMSIEEDDMTQTLISCKDYIGHVHVAENHRYQPGTGAIDFRKHFDTLKRIGYDGAVVVECRIRAKDPALAYAEAEKYLRKCWSGCCD